MAALRSGRSSLAVVAAALAVVYVVWGSTYLAIAVAIRTLPPFTMLAFRFLLAGGILYAWSVRRSGRPTAAQWRAAAIAGGALLFLNTGIVAWAEGRLPTGLTALLAASVPLWIALLDRFVWKRPLTRGAGAGVALGALGVALLVLPGGGSGPIDLVAAAAVVLSAGAWAAGTLYAREAPRPGHDGLTAGMQMLCAGAMLAVAGAATGEFGRIHPQAISLGSLGALAYLVVFGSLVTYTAYGWLVRTVPTSIVSTHAYVNPAVAVALGALVLGEPTTSATLLAGLVIVLSVAFMLASPQEEKEAPVVAETVPAYVRRKTQPASFPVPALADFSRIAA
jgi:drug/metabolite transporter (DMT)-like permease